MTLCEIDWKYEIEKMLLKKKIKHCEVIFLMWSWIAVMTVFQILTLAGTPRDFNSFYL